MEPGLLRPEGTILIRSAFPDHLDKIILFKYLPGARLVAEQFPNVEATLNAFAPAEFEFENFRSIP